MRHALPVGLLILTIGTAFAGVPGRRALAFDDRVEAQRAIENVYWRHRIWPKENPQPKPALAAVKSDAAIRASVADSLRKSEALDKIWKRPISPEQLQAEIDRLVKGTRDPNALQEIFHALGDDPTAIAEALARPILVDRLIRSWYASDDRFHGELRRHAESARARSRTIDGLRSAGATFHETTLRLRLPNSSSETDDALQLEPDDWDHTTRELAGQFGSADEAIPVGVLSDVQEDDDRFFVTEVMSRGDREIRIASVEWPKRSFESWWASQSASMAVMVPRLDADYAVAATASAACVDDSWERTHYAPVGRIWHSAVWTGAEMIVWGGFFNSVALNTGARYDPATDVWTNLAPGGNTPTGRAEHTTVWTGTEMIVWGGDSHGLGPLNTGGRYNPASDSWSPTSMGPSVPSQRYSHAAVWTGTEMIVWGGFGSDLLNTGGRYSPSTNSWVPTATTGSTPVGRGRPTAIWTGTEMIVWGGSGGGYQNTGGRYSPSADGWSATSTGANAPSGRDGHSAVWTGTKMIIWGGSDNNGNEVNTGGNYDPATNSWTPTSVNPSIATLRGGHAAVWTGTSMVIWGGYGNGLLNSGARYNPSSDSWTATSMFGAPLARVAPSGVWTGTEMIVWGGNASTGVGTGGRYNPTTDSWVPVTPGPNVPSARVAHASVWTGNELIVWGGLQSEPPYYPQNGGRYMPAIDAWSPIAIGPNPPAARVVPTAVWTGVEMIMWGGSPPNGGFLNTGGRYNPSTDTWLATSLGVNVPSARMKHVAAWTGRKMIIWGGDNGSYLNTGGQYDPGADSWSATSLGAATPTARYGHSGVLADGRMIVWGGSTQGGKVNSGAAYDATTDSWSPLSVGTNVPSARSDHAAVWTGTEMIVWGGNSGSGYPNTGGRYNPASDTWAATSTGVGVPIGRQRPAGLWTGLELLVWGGSNTASTNTGGRYDPSTDAWRPTSVVSVTAPTTAGTNGPSVAWTGTRMLIWGVSNSDPSMYRYCGFACTGLPTETPSIVLAKAPSASSVTVAWGRVTGATTYDVVRGSLTELRASAGDFSTATETCVADDLSLLSLVDDGVDSEWFLVRVVACGETASYDSEQSSQIQPRDAEIQASGHACQ